MAIFAALSFAPVAWAQVPSEPKPSQAAANRSALHGSITPKSSDVAEPAARQSQDAPAKTASKIDPDKEEVIRKLFEVQGTRKAMQEVLAGMSANLKPTLARTLPPGDYRDKLIDLFFEKFQSSMKIDDLIDLIVPIYDKYFSKEDLLGLTQFYQTPLGKRLNSVLPQLTVEIQTAASKMGEELGRQSMLSVMAEHPDLAKALEDASAGKN